MSQGHEALIGTVIHGYRIERKLGEGGMGQVFIAQHLRLPHLRRVVKTLLKQYAMVEQLRSRFFREAEAVSRLSHDNIITVENFGELPSGELFLMMPLLNGRPLDEVLRTAGKLGPHHTLQIAAQIAGGLQHAHAHGIVHRDLKPGNVFVERRGNQDVVKLLDFGIAKDASAKDAANANSRTRTGLAMGTPSYMACEQYDDAASVGPTADVFALAVVIVEMLTGNLPWGVHADGVLYFRQKTEVPTLTSDVPRAWGPSLLAALAPEPARRPPSARAFVVALANELPALPPVWKTGAQIVKDIAPDLITNSAPDEATIRAKGNAPLSAIPIYPSLASDASDPAPHSDPALASSSAYAAPSMPATVSGRPAPLAPPPTTLTASSGVALSAPSARTRSTALVALGVGGAALAGALTFGLAKMRAGSSQHAGAATRIDASTPSGDARLEAVAPIDAAREEVPATSPLLDAASIDSPVPSDAAIEATKTTSHPGTRAKTTRSTTPKSPAPSRRDGSRTEREFDPNAPAGED